MKLGDILLSAFRGVTANKLRSVLTLLGVLIGVASVILLLAVGNGSAQTIKQSIASLGTDTITVRASSGGGGGGGTTTDNGSTKQLTLGVANQLGDSGLGHVKAVVPEVSSSLTVSSTTTSADSTSIIGTTANYFDVSTAKVATGSAFTEADVTSSAKVAVIGSDLATTLFPTGSALGQTISVDGTPFSVVGVLAEQSSTGFTDPNTVVVAPISRVQRSYSGYGAVSTLLVQATDSDSVDAAQGELEVMLDQLLGVSADDTAPYSITDQSSLLETQEASADSFTVLLGIVAAISLLVGGIGVTNVMLVSVTERTREIGIRLAIGALEGQVLMQFLVEAVTLSIFGGVSGIVIGLALAYGVVGFLGVPFVTSPTIILVAFFFSAAIGMIFGYFPARSAARLNPIEALRHE